MRVLIANPFGIGDVLFSLPLLHALREENSKTFIGYLCNRRTEEIVGHSFPIDWHLVFEKDEFRKAWRRSKPAGIRELGSLIRAISGIQFDTLIDLSLGWHYGLGGALSGIPKRVGFDFRGRGRFLTHRLSLQGFHDQPVSEYYLDLLSLLDLPRPNQIRHSLTLNGSVGTQVAEYLKTQEVHPREKLIAIVPGGGASWGPNALYKQWPPDRFMETANHLASQYQARILLIGDAQEESLCRMIAKGLKSPSILAGIPSLLLLAGLLKRCDLVIGNDSGPMHLAACVGTKTVAIYGPVDGSVYGPLSDPSIHRVVVHGLACRPCYQGFRFPPCPWDNACLKQLDPSRVITAAEELLD
ncbi:MAG: glycosyltransferase family 9 protein [Candidatus Omnitrophica bacterium]|nr:glycosyltransferase family 9 protein [Candidatus Omnitrophota bacterium]